MFLIESNNNFSFELYDELYSSNLPTYLNYSESTLPCHYDISTCLGSSYMSGMHLLAQYIEIIKRISGIADQTILQTSFSTIFSGVTNYMTLKTGMQKVIAYLMTFSRFKYLNSSKDVAYFCEIPMLKRMMHRNGPVVVELFCNNEILNNTKVRGFNAICDDSSISSYKYSKGFIAVGYNSTGMILQNSIGQGYGHAGFIQLNYDLFKRFFIKGCCIQNII